MGSHLFLANRQTCDINAQLVGFVCISDMKVMGSILSAGLSVITVLSALDSQSVLYLLVRASEGVR